MSHYVYVVVCADGTLYTGYTINVKKRVSEHNGEGESSKGRSAGARYTYTRRPVTLLYTEELPSRSAALKRECAIKRMSRKEKLLLCENQIMVRYLSV